MVSSGTITSYNPDVVSASDYYPFGMQMPGRTFSSSSYRYGFNGKENDNDVKGEGNQIDFGARIYDSRIGRFLSVDPLQREYPNDAPYQFAGNSPILMIDKDGKFKVAIHEAIIQEVLLSLGFRSIDHMAVWSMQQSYDLFGATNDNTHFDNKFTSMEVYQRWATLTQEIHNAKLGDPNDEIHHHGADDDIKLGRILHTVQDFYSHSNYVELYIEYYRKKNDTRSSPSLNSIPLFEDGIKDEDFKKNYLDPNLKTGEFNLWRYLFKRDDKEKANAKGHLHHTDVNKDDENSPEGSKPEGGTTLHRYARQTALKATQKILDQKKKEAKQ